jgi:hypothetical protein
MRGTRRTTAAARAGPGRRRPQSHQRPDRRRGLRSLGWNYDEGFSRHRSWPKPSTSRGWLAPTTYPSSSSTPASHQTAVTTRSGKPCTTRCRTTRGGPTLRPPISRPPISQRTAHARRPRTHDNSVDSHSVVAGRTVVSLLRTVMPMTAPRPHRSLSRQDAKTRTGRRAVRQDWPVVTLVDGSSACYEGAVPPSSGRVLSGWSVTITLRRSGSGSRRRGHPRAGPQAGRPRWVEKGSRSAVGVVPSQRGPRGPARSVVPGLHDVVGCAVVLHTRGRLRDDPDSVRALHSVRRRPGGPAREVTRNPAPCRSVSAERVHLIDVAAASGPGPGRTR